MSSNTNIHGIVPVMLTPFTEDNCIDYQSLERLTEWYIANGSDALFAVCQSSEMLFLSLQERVDLAKAVVSQAKGRLPVVASGHISPGLEDQCIEMAAIAETGVDAVILVSNRLDPEQSGFDAFRHSLEAIMSRLPADMPLGLYECPAPYRRLLTDDEIKLCRDTGRFVALKDVSCDLETVKRRADLVKDTSFSIINANAAIAIDAMRHGSKGFAGVFTNFHPDLYAWAYANLDRNDELMRELTTFLALSAMAEPMGYPKLAKAYQKKIGNFASTHTRAIDFDIFDRFWALDVLLEHIHSGAEDFRKKIAAEAS